MKLTRKQLNRIISASLSEGISLPGQDKIVEKLLAMPEQDLLKLLIEKARDVNLSYAKPVIVHEKDGIVISIALDRLVVNMSVVIPGRDYRPTVTFYAEDLLVNESNHDKVVERILSEFSNKIDYWSRDGRFISAKLTPKEAEEARASVREARKQLKASKQKHIQGVIEAGEAIKNELRASPDLAGLAATVLISGSLGRANKILKTLDFAGTHEKLVDSVITKLVKIYAKHAPASFAEGLDVLGLYAINSLNPTK